MNRQGADGITYVDFTWNPITGCSKGCKWCYARRLAKRFGWSFEPTFHLNRVWEPLKLKRPSRILTCSMGDMFDDAVSAWDIDCILEVMLGCPHHEFLVLTKRPENLMSKLYAHDEYNYCRALDDADYIPNLWLGVSVACQEDADQRIPLLLDVPAALYWLSVEPMLGPVDLSEWLAVERLQMPWGEHWTERTGDVSRLHWVVVGAQTGPGAVPPKREWVQSLVEQCRTASVPVFLKRNLARVWPGELVQEYPK